VSEVQEEKSVYQHLLGAAAAFTPDGKAKFKKQGKKETDAEFLSRLLERVSELPKEQYDALPEDTVHAWFNAAAEAFNASQPLPEPDGFRAPATEDAGNGEDTSADDGDTRPRIHARAEVTVGSVIRKLLIENQKTTRETIRDALAVAGFRNIAPSTVNSYCFNTLATLQIAAEMGRFTPSP
jgi:hypothetical protein